MIREFWPVFVSQTHAHFPNKSNEPIINISTKVVLKVDIIHVGTKTSKQTSLQVLIENHRSAMTVRVQFNSVMIYTKLVFCFE